MTPCLLSLLRDGAAVGALLFRFCLCWCSVVVGFVCGVLFWVVRIGQSASTMVLWCFAAFFFLRLPNGQYGPVSQLSRSEKCCTGPFNWGEAHCAGEKVKRKIGPFQRKSL